MAQWLRVGYSSTNVHVFPELMRTSASYAALGRRERQIVDTVYQLGRASVAQVLEQLSDPPSYSAVRAMLRLLEDKGYLRHTEEGGRYVYEPRLPHEQANRPVLMHLVSTFFRGSTEAAMAALLEESKDELSDAQLTRLAQMIDRARNKR
jgi:BlaI family transcriptional regulator, penicillinase repressor